MSLCQFTHTHTHTHTHTQAGVLPAHPRLVLEASRKREAAQHIKDKPLELDPPSENNSPIESVDAHDTT